MDAEPTTQTEPAPQATLPAITRTAILTASALDCAYRYDLSGYPGLNYFVLATMPSVEIVSRWHIP